MQETIPANSNGKLQNKQRRAKAVALRAITAITASAGGVTLSVVSLLCLANKGTFNKKTDPHALPVSFQVDRPLLVGHSESSSMRAMVKQLAIDVFLNRLHIATNTGTKPSRKQNGGAGAAHFNVLKRVDTLSQELIA